MFYVKSGYFARQILLHAHDCDMDNLRVIFNSLDEDCNGEINSEELFKFFEESDRQVGLNVSFEELVRLCFV